MREQERREFLKKLAQGAVYAAPVIRTMAAPLEVVAQGHPASHKHGQHGHGGSWSGSAPSGGGLGGPAPGSGPPPGATPPP